MRHLLFFFICLSILSSTSADFSWKEVREEKKDGYRVFLLEVTSQKWRDETEVDKPLWVHPLRVFVPDDVKSDHVLLFAKGGYREDALPAPKQELLDEALKTKAVVAELFSTLNQPLVFKVDGKEKRDDALVAYSWKRFLEGGDNAWPLHAPMAKAISSAITAIESFLKDKVAIKGFVVSGESKFGWASWLAAERDTRIKAIVPVVSDFLNIPKNFMHHLASLGSWSPVIQDYLDHGFSEKVLESPRFAELLKLEDPYSFREKLTLPKYLVYASGDPFSMPDATSTYIKDLKGPVYLRLLPNCGHHLKCGDYYPSLFTFFRWIAKGETPPLLTTLIRDGELEIQSNLGLKNLALWSSHNPKARDFRFDFSPSRWSKGLIESSKISLKAPENGWKAQFIEANLETKEGLFVQTSEAFILPNKFPSKE